MSRSFLNNSDDSRSTTSENTVKSETSNSTLTSSHDQTSTIAFGLMSTMAVRPILEHVAPDTRLNKVDEALNDVKTATSSVYGLTNDQLKMIDEVQRFLPGHTKIFKIRIISKNECHNILFFERYVYLCNM